ncbi:hypothetical protein F4V43_01660 [Paenibacillus spiritus]|uniref:Uncharacterized protein n=1 Tax=Paenibacillus spiritus TaxID=2496557 RepID=A0A5J5GG79_9BACL|nr:hypothetical protein [Paenibacillus spiritus]KAA9007219.1 hypothetical protein F4V43_01660 [Paenibacillus spiritus]
MTNEEVFELRNLLIELSTKTRISESTKERINKASASFENVYENAKLKEIKRKYKEMKFSYSQFNPESATGRIVEAINSSIALYDEANRDLKLLDKETQDILHAFEMCDLKEEEEKQLTEDLKQVRVARRKCKNFIEMVTPLMNFSKKHRGLANEIGEVQKSIKGIIETIESRTYSPKVRKELVTNFESAKNTYMSIESVQV